MDKHDDFMIVPDHIFRLFRALVPEAFRPYIVADWAVEPENRCWPENRISISYRVTQ